MIFFPGKFCDYILSLMLLDFSRCYTLITFNEEIPFENILKL